MKNNLIPFFFKITVLLLLILLLSFVSKAATFTITPTGNKTNAQIRAAINAACSCTSATLAATDTIRILVAGTNTVNVAPNNEVWNLTDYNIVKIDIDGENSQLIVNKQAEIRLSANSFLVVSPTNTDGFRPLNTGNSYLRIGNYDFHGNGGNSFDAVIAAGGATSAGATGPPVALPIKLLYFKAIKNGEHVLVEWATLLELNNDYFVVEKSTDGNNFYKIGELQGSGTTSEVMNYSYLDDSFNAVDIVYYRLKQVDFDGQSEVFNIIALQLNSATGSDLLFVYPNPAEKYIKVFSQVLTSNDFSYEITNLNGNVIETGVSTWAEPLSVEALNAGVYRLMVNHKDVIKLVKN